MHYISSPASSLKGCITVPGDKSISHRAIIFGAIAEGNTHIEGFLDGEDCRATRDAFRAMGVVIEQPEKNQIKILGVGKRGLMKPAGLIHCGNSGTTMRLLTGLLAAQPFDSILTGDESLLRRPMGRVTEPLNQMGANIRTHDHRAPLHIMGGARLHGIRYEIPHASAQLKSALLLAGLYAEGKTTLIEREITRDHTERMLAQFSYPLHQTQNEMTIDSEQECIGTSIKIPGDLSSAAFFIVAATLIPGSMITIRNVGINPSRTGFIEILNQMGAIIQFENKRLWGHEPVADITAHYAPLKGIEIPIGLVVSAIDEFPILFIAAACASGRTVLKGAKELRLKESDRISAMADGLNRLGIKALAQSDGMIIDGGKFHGGEVNSYDDHRIAMAFSIAGAIASAPIKINRCHNVSTSFPDFVEIANQLHLLIERQCV